MILAHVRQVTKCIHESNTHLYFRVLEETGLAELAYELVILVSCDFLQPYHTWICHKD